MAFVDVDDVKKNVLKVYGKDKGAEILKEIL